MTTIVTLAAAATPAVTGANPVAVAAFVDFALEHSGIGPYTLASEAVTTDADGVVTYTANYTATSFGKTGTISYTRSAPLDLEAGVADQQVHRQWSLVLTYDGTTLMTQTKVA